MSAPQRPAVSGTEIARARLRAQQAVRRETLRVVAWVAAGALLGLTAAHLITTLAVLPR
jgi:hypothetical protein